MDQEAPGTKTDDQRNDFWNPPQAEPYGGRNLSRIVFAVVPMYNLCKCDNDLLFTNY